MNRKMAPVRRWMGKVWGDAPWETSFWVLGTGYWILDSGFWILDNCGE